MKKLILFCLVVMTVFAEETTKFDDGAKDGAEKDVAEKDVADKDVAEKDVAEKDVADKDVAEKDAAQKDVAQKKAHRARFEDAVKGYEDAVKEEAQARAEEAHAQAEEARAKAEEAHALAAKKRSLRSMLQAEGGPDLFDDVIKRMEEQDRLLKEHTAEISSLKSNQIHCFTWKETTEIVFGNLKRPITFKPAFKSTPDFVVSICGFKNKARGSGFQALKTVWVTWEKVGPSGITLVYPDYANEESVLFTVQVIACGH